MQSEYPRFTPEAFDGFLDDITTPFLTRKVDLWRKWIVLPFSMVTSSGPVTLRTDQDVERNFALYLLAADTMGMDMVVREPISIEHCADGTVLATYRTNLLAKGKRLIPPYTSTALIHPPPVGWGMSAILNARGHHHWTGNDPTEAGH